MSEELLCFVVAKLTYFVIRMKPKCVSITSLDELTRAAVTDHR